MAAGSFWQKHLYKENEFVCVQDRDKAIILYYGRKNDVCVRLVNGISNALFRFLARGQYIKGYLKDGFVETTAPFSEEAQKIIELEPYLLKRGTYLENAATGEFMEIERFERGLRFRSGKTGTLGYKSQKINDRWTKAQIDDQYFALCDQYLAQGYKYAPPNLSVSKILEQLAQEDAKKAREAEFAKKREKEIEAMEEVAENAYRHGKACVLSGDTINEWPWCLQHLTPERLRDPFRMPEYLASDIPLPVSLVKVWGTCPTHYFPSCPNQPDYRDIDAKPDSEFSADFVYNQRTTDGSRYIWCDLLVKDGVGDETPVRVAYNIGSGDSNEGYWGAAWNSVTKKKLVDIRSTGDIETTFAVVPSAAAIWKDTGLRLAVPADDTEGKWDVMLVRNVLYATGNELERFIQIGIMLCDAAIEST